MLTSCRLNLITYLLLCVELEGRSTEYGPVRSITHHIQPPPSDMDNNFSRYVLRIICASANQSIIIKKRKRITSQSRSPQEMPQGLG